MRRRDFLAADMDGTVAAALAPRRALGDSQRWVPAMDPTPRVHRLRGHRADMLIIDDPPGTDQPGHWTYTLDGGGVYDSRLGRFRCWIGIDRGNAPSYATVTVIPSDDDATAGSSEVS